MGTALASSSAATASWLSARSQSPCTMRSCARKIRGLASEGFLRTSSCRSFRQPARSPARSLLSAPLTVVCLQRRDTCSELHVLRDVPREIRVLALGTLVGLGPILELHFREVERDRLRRYIRAVDAAVRHV